MTAAPRTVAVLGDTRTAALLAGEGERWYQVVAAGRPADIVIADQAEPAVAAQHPGALLVLHRAPGETTTAEAPTGWSVIDLRREGFAEEGAEYRARFLAELHALDLGRRLPPDLAAQVAVIAQAARDRNERQAAFLKAVMDEQADVIAGYERRGLLRALLSGRAR